MGFQLKSTSAPSVPPSPSRSIRSGPFEYTSPMTVGRVILIVSCLLLAACQKGQRGWFDNWGKKDVDLASTANSAPPDDFWLSVTVTGPVRESMAAYDALPRALRPARYVLEADHVLRAAVGPGAKDEAFPAPTRRLSSMDVTQLYRLVGEAGLLDADHPNLVGSVPQPKFEERGRSDAVSDRDLRTTYIVSLHAHNKQRTLVMEASPRGTQDSRQAARVVDWLANKAWLKPSMQAR